jgi:hypothetical protein
LGEEVSEQAHYTVEATEMLNSVMIMRETAALLIAFKKQHPVAFPGDSVLWAQDIDQLEHIILQYDSLIVKLLEINMKQGDLMDKMAARMQAVLDGSA